MAKKKTAQKTARSELKFPLEEALRLAWAEVQAAARRLGFDTRGDCFKRVLNEECGRPECYTLGEVNSLGKPVFARASAVESLAFLLDGLRDLRNDGSFENGSLAYLFEREEWTKLRRALASKPAGRPLKNTAEAAA